MRHEGKLSKLYPEYCGSVHFSWNTLPSALPIHLTECLRRVGAWDITVAENRVTCKASSVGTIGNVLAPFRGADLEVDFASREVRYRLRTAHMPVIATVVTCLTGVFFLATGFFRAPFVGVANVVNAVFLPFVWIWFAGGGILIGIPLFTAFLRRSISTAPKTPVDPS